MIEKVMRKKRVAVIPSLLLVILLGALAVWTERAQAAHHLDFSAQHEAPSIHCREPFPNSNIQAAWTIQSHRRNLNKALPSIHEKIDSVVSVVWFKDQPSRGPFSQQGLFRFEQVYRL
jgi:hypothetical protein